MVGMIAVALSLLMVVYGLDQNTEALQVEHGNLIFERRGALQMQVIGDEKFAAIRVKLAGSEPQLSRVESMRRET